jgi:hypothetical protein
VTRPDHERRPDAPTLVEFLRARLDEDEQVARAARSQEWQHDGRNGLHDLGPAYCTVIRVSSGFSHVQADHVCGSVLFADAQHIVRHDPARVLADVEAKRRIVDEYEATQNPLVAERASDGAQFVVDPGERWRWHGRGLETALRLLALPYADHDGYRDEWRP